MSDFLKLPRAKRDAIWRELRTACAFHVSESGRRVPSWFACGGPARPNKRTADGMQWIDEPEKHFRDLGPCDEIARSIKHRGYFTDGEGTGESVRGNVYRISHSRFLAGFADPYGNDAAAIDCSRIHTDETEAARAADECARIYGELAREHDAKFREEQEEEEAAHEAAERAH